MGFRNTYKHKVGPFTLNFSNRFTVSSATVRLFGVTYRLWSKHSEKGIASVDIPGSYSYRPKARRKQNRDDED